ncbi:MAG: DUF5915 domain-containing protein [Thermoplasmata archaeon]
MTTCRLCDAPVTEKTQACSFCGVGAKARPKKRGRQEVERLLEASAKRMESAPEGFDARTGQSLLTKARRALEDDDLKEASRLGQGLKKGLELAKRRATWRGKVAEAKLKLEIAAGAGMEVAAAQEKVDALEERVRRDDFTNMSQALQGALRGLRLTGHAGKAWKRLEEAKKAIGYARERGGQTGKALEFLQRAQEALQQADFARATQLAAVANRAADYARKYARAVQLIAGVERKLQEAADRGAEVRAGKEYLQRAQKALKSGVYADVQKWTRTAREFGERARKTKIAEDAIRKVEKALEAEAAEGSDLSETIPLLEEAWKALAEGRFREVPRHLRKASALAKEAARVRRAREALELLATEIQDLQAMKADPVKAQRAAAQAEEALEKGTWPAYRRAWSRAVRETNKARRERERELVLNTVEMLVEKAGKGGVSAIGARELLVEVEKALSKGSYTDIETLVEAKFEAEATKRENELIRRMAGLRTTQAELKVAGIEVSAAAGLLEKAGEALKDRRIKEADDLLTRAEEATEGLREVLAAAALRALEDLRTELTSLDRLEVSVPQAQAFHDRARSALSEGDALQALDLANLGLEACREARTKHFDRIAEKELEEMRSVAALKEAEEKLGTAREFAALLDRAEIEHDALDDVVARAEEALGKKEVEDLRILLQVVTELEASLKVALKQHIATRLGELERIIRELQDLEEAGEFHDALAKLQKALKANALAEALEEAQGLEVKVAEAQAREAQRLAEAQADELVRLSELSARVKGILESLWKAGIDVSDSQETFHQAVVALQENELSKASPLLEDLEATAAAIQSDLARAAHEFIASARRQLKKAEKTWKPIPEVQDLLLLAQELFDEKRFDEAIEVARIAERKTRAQKEQAKDEARGEVTRRILEFQERLFHLKEVLRDLRRADISIEDSEELLAEVEESLAEADFETADGKLAELEEVANGLAGGLQIAAKDLLKSVGKQLKQVEAEGLSVPRGENVYATAKESLKAGRFVEALEYCKVIEDIVEDARIRAKLANMDEVVEGLQEQLRKLEGPGVRLGRAHNLLEEAREAAAVGEQERALALSQGVAEMLEDLQATPLAKGAERKAGGEAAVSVEGALNILDRVESSWESGDTMGMEEMLAAARTKLGADGTPAAKAAIKEVSKGLRLAEKIGLEVDEAKKALTEAKRLLKEDPGGALAAVGQARELLRSAARDMPPETRPALQLDIPEKGLEEGRWTRFSFYVKNQGKTPASDVKLRLRGDVEVKGLESVQRLAPRENRLVSADVKAGRRGQIPLEIDVTYRGTLDGDEVYLTEAASVDASPSGTYLVEDAFLVHTDGRLISHQTRKIEDEIDEDVFSGMLTVVQDFVKDSFRTRTRVGLRRLEFGDSRILIERGPNVYLAAVLLGEEPDLLSLYMVELINEIERKFGDKLDKWSGMLSELEGIEEVCRKLCYFTKEGWILDPEGTKSAIGEAMNLIRGGRALGLDLSESEALLEKARGAVEKDVQNAWNFIEDAVEKALATQQELQKKLEAGVQALGENLEGLSLLGHGVEGGKEDLQQAKAALALGQYEEAARVISNLDDTVSALKEEVLAVEIESTVGRLSRTVGALEQEGADVSGLKEELGAAQEAWEKGQLGQVATHLESAHEEARDLKRTYLLKRHREELEDLSEMYERASAQGFVPEGARAIVQQATEAAEREDVDELDVLLPQARQAVQVSLEGEFEGREPEVHLAGVLPPLQMGAWARYEMELSNKGTWPAEDVSVEFDGDIEVKGPTTVEGLGPGETKRLTVGLKPSKAGATMADVRVSYQRLLDDARYVAHYIRDVKVAGKGTYLVEDALLFLPDGRMLIHESQKFREELDEDLFLTMIQGVQDFLKDAFENKLRVGIKRMDFKDSKVLLERGDHCYLGAVVVGDEPDLLPLYLLQLLYEAEERYGDHLGDWQDDSEAQEGLREIVRKALLISESSGADLRGLGSSPITQDLLEGVAAKERRARVEAMMPAVEKALVKNGPRAGLAAVRAALAPKEEVEGRPSPTERPQGDEGRLTVELDDESLKEFIEIVKEIDKAVRKARGKAGLEYHWPVPRIAIRAKTPNVAAAAENFKTMILSHANARQIDILEAGQIWHGVDLKMTIDEDVLERSYQVWSRKIQLILMSQDPWKIKAGIDKGGYEMGIEGQVVKIDGDMVGFQVVIPPHVIVQDFGAGMVFMDTRLSEEEEAEGFANEIIKIVLEARKDLGLGDSDPILIQLVANERLRFLLGRQKEYLLSEVNAKDLRFVSDAGEEGFVADVEISDETFTIGVTASAETS